MGLIEPKLGKAICKVHKNGKPLKIDNSKILSCVVNQSVDMMSSFRLVLTDNDLAYRAHVFQTVARRARVRHLRTRPYRPQTNGKAERFIQTLQREWAYATAYPSSRHRTRALQPWVRHYNRARPHTSLGYRPPAARLPRVGQ